MLKNSKKVWFIAALASVICVLGILSAYRLARIRALERAGYGGVIFHEQYALASLFSWRSNPSWTLYRNPSFLAFRSSAPDNLISGVRELKGIKTIYLAPGFDERQLSLLGTLPELEELYLVNLEISDEGLKYLKDMPALEELYLIRLEITNEGLKHLKGMPQLRRLHLCRLENIDDEGLVVLESLQPLEYIEIVDTFSADGIGELRSSRPELEIDEKQ